MIQFLLFVSKVIAKDKTFLIYKWRGIPVFPTADKAQCWQKCNVFQHKQWICILTKLIFLIYMLIFPAMPSWEILVVIAQPENIVSSVYGVKLEILAQFHQLGSFHQ